MAGLANLDNLRAEASRQFHQIKSLLHKPPTRDNIYFHYLPLGGCVSYALLSSNVMDPSLSEAVYTSFGLSSDMSTNLALLSTIGLSLHIYNRQTFAGKDLVTRAGLSVYQTGMFVLGSVLGWAIVARSLPDSSILKTGLSLMSSISMLKLAKLSLDHVDSKMGRALGGTPGKMNRTL